jgi:hypothetical protein
MDGKHGEIAINRWQESNCALARLLAKHRRHIGRAAAMAGEIRRAIDALAPWMAALCSRTCLFCPEPCCISNTVWFDFRDLLYLHLLEEAVPARQALTDSLDACPFLSPRGCRLPWRIRPWMCIQYLCPAQRAVIEKAGQPVSRALFQKIKRTGLNRLRMEAEVVRCIKGPPRNQTSNVMRSGFSTNSLTRLRKVTAPLPSTTRWS